MSRSALEYSQAVSAKSWRRSISKAMRACSRCGKLPASDSPRTKRSRSPSALILVRLAQLVRVAGGEIEPVDRSQRADLLQRGLRERRLALQGVQHDALEQIAEREVELGRERLQHLEQPALEAHAGLCTGDLLHRRNVTKLPMYLQAGPQGPIWSRRWRSDLI